jgi:hypothetical protein
LSGEPKRLSRWRFGKWHPRHLQRRQHFRQALQFLRRHAGARSTGVAQPTVFGVVAQPQGTDILSTSLGIRPSNDHELLADEAFGFDPDPAVARCVWSAGALGDDAFQAELAGVLTETRAAPSHMLTVPHALDFFLEQPLEPLLALVQRQFCRTPPIEKQKIKGEEHELIRPAFIHCRL